MPAGIILTTSPGLGFPTPSADSEAVGPTPASSMTALRLAGNVSFSSECCKKHEDPPECHIDPLPALLCSAAPHGTWMSNRGVVCQSRQFSKGGPWTRGSPSTSPGSLLGMQLPGPYLRSAESETLGLGPNNLHFDKPLGGF